MRILFGILMLTSLFFMGCKDEKTLQEELAEIDTYIQEKGYTVLETGTGLHYFVKSEGSGITNPELSDEVTVDYKGELLDGTIFDQNDNITFELTGLVQGWQEGIQLMNKGDTYVLIFPSTLGYGSRGQGSIPGYAPLAFEITLRDF